MPNQQDNKTETEQITGSACTVYLVEMCSVLVLCFVLILDLYLKTKSKTISKHMQKWFSQMQSDPKHKTKNTAPSLVNTNRHSEVMTRQIKVYTVSQKKNKKQPNSLSFIVHKSNVPESSAVGAIGVSLYTPMVNVFHKPHGFFVSVNQGQAVVLWIDCKELRINKGLVVGLAESQDKNT